MGGTDRAVTRACKLWDFKSPVVWSRRIEHCFNHPNIAPSFILSWLALQTPCSLCREANSCAPPPLPRPDSEIKKRAPVPRLLGSDSVAQLSQLLCLLFHPVNCDCAFKTVYVSVFMYTSLIGLVGSNYLWG